MLHGGQPMVLASAAAVYPLLPPHRRQLGSLAGTCHADLVHGAQLTAVLPDSCSLNSSPARSSSSSGGQGAGSSIELRLAGVAELPGVRAALARLLAAPSSAGPGGWQLGWLLHQHGRAQPAQLSQMPAERLTQQQSLLSQPQQLQQQQPPPQQPASHPPSLAPDMLAVGSHVAVLQATSPAGAQVLRQAALPWHFDGAAAAAAAQPGQAVYAAGAPFGALAPQHFTGFLTTGIVSAVLPGSCSSGGENNSDGGGSGQPALLLADLRCSPGMEGGPVFAGKPNGTAYASTAVGMAADGAAGAAAEQPAAGQPHLLGMLLPPLKAPAVHVEWAAVAPAAAAAAAAKAVLGPAASATGGGGGSPGSSRSTCQAGSEPPTAGAAAALRGVVAVAAGGSWASGVLVSEAGHVLTNAHLLQPTAAAASSSRSGGSEGSWPGRPQMQAWPTAAARAHPPVQVLLPGAAGGGEEDGLSGCSWAAADVLYVFQGPLDLAVLKLRQAARAQQQQQQQQQQAQQPPQQAQQAQQAGWRPLRLSRRPPQPGQLVLVAGFPAYSPRSSPLGGPVLTAGTLAKVGAAPSFPTSSTCPLQSSSLLACQLHCAKTVGSRRG